MQMITITLTPELEKVITAQAKRAGVTPERFSLDNLKEYFSPTSPADSEADAPTLEDKIAALVTTVPDEEWKTARRHGR